MRVAELEHRTQALDFQDNSVLPFDRIGGIIRRILREEFWCRLEGSESFIHFGWDYYMYVGVRHPCPAAQARAMELGLYVEEFASPYRVAKLSLSPDRSGYGKLPKMSRRRPSRVIDWSTEFQYA